MTLQYDDTTMLVPTIFHTSFALNQLSGLSAGACTNLAETTLLGPAATRISVVAIASFQPL